MCSYVVIASNNMYEYIKRAASSNPNHFSIFPFIFIVPVPRLLLLLLLLLYSVHVTMQSNILKVPARGTSYVFSPNFIVSYCTPRQIHDNKSKT